MRSQKYAAALEKAALPEISEVRREIVRATNAMPRSMRRERPAIVTACFNERLYGASVLVLGGDVEALAIATVYPDGLRRKANYTFEIFHEDGQTYAQRFSSLKTQFSVEVAHKVPDNAYMRLTIAPELTDAEKKQTAETGEDIKPMTPSYVSFGISLRVRKEVVTIEPIYGYDEDEV